MADNGNNKRKPKNNSESLAKLEKDLTTAQNIINKHMEKIRGVVSDDSPVLKNGIISKKQLDSFNRDIQKIESTISRMRSKTDSMQSNNSQQKKLEDLQKRFDKLNKEYESQKSGYTNSNKGLDVKIASLEKHYRRIDTLYREQKKNLTGKEEIPESFNNLEKKRESLRNQLETLQSKSTPQSLKDAEKRYSDLDKMYREQKKNLTGKEETPESFKRLEEKRESARKKLEEETNKASSSQGEPSENFKKLEDARNKLEKELKDNIRINQEYEESVKKVVDRLNDLQSSTNSNVNNERSKLNNVVVGDTNSDNGSKMAGLLTRGILGRSLNMGVLPLFSYARSGAMSVRTTDENAYRLGQRIGYSDYGNDRDIKQVSENVGRLNEYDAQSTLQTQSTLASGGYNSLSDLMKDVQSAQSFGRAYAVDPDTVSSSFSELQKMGSMKDGDMQRFSNILSGSITKTNMRGREEEALRSLTSVISELSSVLPEVTQDNALSMAELQATLGDSISSLSGDRGSNVINSMSSAFQNPNQSLGISMGLGNGNVTDTYKKLIQMEQGATPENIKELVSTITHQYGTNWLGSTDELDATGVRARRQMSTSLGLSNSTLETMISSGFIDKIISGNTVSSEELEKYGVTDTQNKLSDREDTKTYTQQGIDADNTSRKQRFGEAYDNVSKVFSSAFNGLPNIVQDTATVGGALFGGNLAYKTGSKLWSSVGKLFKPNANTGTSAMGGIAKGLSDSSSMGSVSSSLSSIADDMIAGGGKLAGVGGKAVKGLSKLASYAPLVGGVFETVTDQVENPEHDLSRSVTKGVGSGLGTWGGAYAGTALGTMLAPVTAGLSIPVGALLGGLAGGSLGAWGGDKAYSLVSGDEDKTREKDAESRKKLTQSTDSEKSYDNYNLETNQNTSQDISGKVDVNIKITSDTELDPKVQVKIGDSIADYVNSSVLHGTRFKNLLSYESSN